jgi:hypothetical protein
MTPTEQGSRRCDFSRVRCGVVSCNILSRGTICNFVNFYLTHASFVSSRACIGFITVLFGLASAEPDVVTLSSSDTKEALELLSLSPDRGVSSQPSRVGGGGEATPRNLHQALILVVTCSRIGPKPMIWP